MTRRPSVSKSDLAKVLSLLNDHGTRIAKVEVTPDRVVITTTDGEVQSEIKLTERALERERAKENWDPPAKRKR